LLLVVGKVLLASGPETCGLRAWIRRGALLELGLGLVVSSGGAVLVAFFEAPGREALGDGRGQPDFSVGTAKEKEIRARTYVFAPSRPQDEAATAMN